MTQDELADLHRSEGRIYYSIFGIALLAVAFTILALIWATFDASPSTDYRDEMITALVHDYAARGKKVIAVEVSEAAHDALGVLEDDDEFIFETPDGDVEIRARTSRKNPVILEGDE